MVPKQEEIDSSQPIPFDEKEELERISAMLQRDNLVRCVGVYDQVHRMLGGDPSPVTANEKPKV